MLEKAFLHGLVGGGLIGWRAYRLAALQPGRSIVKLGKIKHVPPMWTTLETLGSAAHKDKGTDRKMTLAGGVTGSGKAALFLSFQETKFDVGDANLRPSFAQAAQTEVEYYRLAEAAKIGGPRIIGAWDQGLTFEPADGTRFEQWKGLRVDGDLRDALVQQAMTAHRHGIPLESLMLVKGKVKNSLGKRVDGYKVRFNDVHHFRAEPQNVNAADVTQRIIAAF